MPYELRDIAPGLWIWRLEHPDWKPGLHDRAAYEEALGLPPWSG